MIGHQVAELGDGAQVAHLLAVDGQRQRHMRLIRPDGRMEGAPAGDDAAHALQNGEVIEAQIDRVGQRPQLRCNDGRLLQLLFWGGGGYAKLIHEYKIGQKLSLVMRIFVPHTHTRVRNCLIVLFVVMS